jgi:hypothetical protein
MPESRHSSLSGRLRLPRLRGAAVPAALVGVSVLLVLLVVAVSTLMGNDRASVIPLGAGSPQSDQGQVLDGQTQAGPNGGSPSTRASKSAKPAPSRSAPPTQPVAAATAPAAPPFQPVSVEAESATLSPPAGTPSPSPCSTCSGGSKVRFVGRGRTVTFSGLTVPAAAIYHLTITYELVGSRSFWITVNGGSATEVPCAGTNDWYTMVTKTVTVVLRAGANTITFGNPSADAPDLDKITLGP